MKASDVSEMKARQCAKISKRPTNPALVGRCRAWEVCSVIGKLVSMHDDGYDFDRSRAPATVDDL